MSSPENKQNCYTTFDEPVYFFTDDAVVPPPKTNPPAPPSAEPRVEQPEA